MVTTTLESQGWPWLESGHPPGDLATGLLLIAALGQSWWWRAGELWYGGAAFAWGCFFLAAYLTWPTVSRLL